MKLLNQLHRTLPLIFSILSLLLADAPNWQDNPGAYEFTATISGGIVLSDGQQFSESGDIFAAFDDNGNVRGIAIQLSPPFGPYEGEIVYEMQMRSNDAGDLLSFKYYDASEDAVLDIAETYEFEVNDIIGDVVDPVFYNIAIAENYPDWQDNPGAYEFTATISGGIVLSDGQQFSESGDIFAAFDDNGNVRGIAIQLSPPFGPYEGEIVYEMQMRSNDEGDLLSFKFYDASEDAVLDIAETYEFVINDIIGNVMEPIEFNIGSGSPPCEDDDFLVAPFTCTTAVATFGCDMAWGGITIGEACPETCGTCPVYGCTDSTADNYNPNATDDDGTCEYPECADDESLIAPFTCASAVTSFGCDFVWGTITISEALSEATLLLTLKPILSPLCLMRIMKVYSWSA